MERDPLYAKHILDAIILIEGYVKGIDYKDFRENSLYQDAVLRELLVIGEAAKRLSRDFKTAIPHIPWKEITGARDRLIHDYFKIDLQLVWNTIQHDLPTLKQALQNSIPK